MRPRVKGALLLLLAFGLGLVGGAVGYGAYHARFDGWRSPQGASRFQQYFLSKLTKELDLRADQRERVEGILKEAGQAFGRLREEIGPRFREIRTQAQDRIRAALDTGQQAQFDVLAREWERRAERWRGRGGRPEGPETKAP
jgi:hypothetical protein